MKFKKTVLQTVDSPRRDLEWRVFMALKLSKEGISSVIGSVGQINALLEKSNNCIYFGRLPSNTGRTDFDNRMLSLMKKNNTSLFFLHDEGAFFLKGEYEQATKRVYPENLFSLPVVEKVFFWGKEQVKVFEKHSEKAKFLVTGSPRFDLCLSKYQVLDHLTVRNLKNKYKDFVLVSGRFSAVNMVPDDPSFLSKRKYEIHIEGGGLEYSTKNEILTKMFKDWEKTSIEFSRFVSSLAKLAMEFPELNFVFRPHPAECSSLYKESFSHFNNIFVDKSFDVRPFIRASKLVIHAECSTGVEAEISGKPNINYRPCMSLKEFDGIEVAGVSEVGVVVESYEELRSCLQNFVSSEFKFTKSACDMSTYLLNSNGINESADVIVKEIKSFCKINTSESSISNLAWISQLSINRLLRSLKLFLKQVWLHTFFKKHIESGDSKVIFYPNKKIEKLWLDLGGNPECIKIKNGVIFTYPEEAKNAD